VETNAEQILFFDLLTDSNPVLKELVFSAISKLTENNKFWLITEGISFIGKNDSKVDTVFVKNQNNLTLIYSGEDVPMLTSQTENIFETLTGGNTQLLLFAHTSGNSAEKWARYFGTENKTKVSQMQGTSNSGFMGWDTSTNKGTSVSTEKEYKFPPQHFMPPATTTDINNNSVFWGLSLGECYFISSITSFVASALGYLPKMSLQPTSLMLK